VLAACHMARHKRTSFSPDDPSSLANVHHPPRRRHQRNSRNAISDDTRDVEAWNGEASGAS
jgi:hypothetical protein